MTGSRGPSRAAAPAAGGRTVKLPVDATERRRRIAGWCLVFAPLLMLVADAMLLAAGEEAAFWPWTLGVWVSFYLFIGAVLAIARLLSRKADRLGLTGAALAIAGAMMGATIQGLFRVLKQMEAGGFEEATIRAIHSPLVPTTEAPGLLFPIGLLVLAVGLWKTRVFPRGLTVVFGLGAVLFPVGRILVGPAASVASDVLLLVAMGDLGRRVLRSPLFWTPGLRVAA